MNKTKMILAGIGGTIGVVVLALGFLVWQAFSAKTAALEGDYDEGIDGLETVENRVQTLSRKPVYPCAESVAAIEQNQKAIEEWCKDGLSLAVRGDKVYEKTTAPKFKAFLVADAHRIAELPGGAAGKLVKPDFAFGPFKDYISEGKMPAEADLANLQRQWDDVSTIAEMMSTNGVTELVDVQFAVANRDQGSGIRDQVKKGSGTRDQVKKGTGSRNQAKKGSGSASLIPDPLSHSYVFTFTARPQAFIRMLNELESAERYIVVDGFGFTRPQDVISDALGGDEKKAAEAVAPAGGRRGRRNRTEKAAAAAKPSAEDGDAKAGKNGIVTDPLLDAPLTVTVTLTVHDFNSLEDNGEAASSPLEKKGEAASSPLEEKGNSK